MKKLILISIVILFASCESEWQMQTKETESIYYQCKGSAKITSRVSNWIFTGTKSEAEAETGVKYYSGYEYPYCVNRTFATTLVGKK